MRWDQTEYLLKGLYLGLLLMVALHSPTWSDVGLLAACTLGGLALALAGAGIRNLRGGFRIQGRFLGFLLFLVLESPQAVFTGILGGLTIGAYLIVHGKEQTEFVVGPIVGGIALGLLLWFLRHSQNARQRTYLGLALAVALVGGAVAALWFHPLPHDQLTMLGAILLLGIPGFYLLTFASLEEESEVEIAALCAALGIGLWALGANSSPPLRSLPLVVPLGLYLIYSQRVLPRLRVFKHALRGLSYRQVGQVDQALASLSRALELNPRHPLAREQLWDLHRNLDYDQVKDHPTILRLINYPLCLDRASTLLLADAPQPAQIREALHLLDFVARQRPDLEPACWYWRAVAKCHERDYDTAEQNLHALLSGEAPADPKGRRRVLFQAWQLAILLHPEMKRRVGMPLLEHPARRFEAIAAVERQLVEKPDDTAAWDLKRLLYSPLTEADYLSQTPEGKVRDDFDYRYVQELGLALVDQPEQWQRGGDFVRIAARGLPLNSATLYTTLARAHERQGDIPGMWANYQKAMQLGRAVGVANLAAEDRQNLFTAVKQIGERAMAENQLDTALDAFKFYSQKESAGIETYRILAELFERKGDVWHALHCTEHALTYNDKDANLIARKDKYYYSIMPDDLKARWESVGSWFDPEYCRTKSQLLLDKAGNDLDMLDWAGHLTELLGVAQPASLSALILRARVRRLRGEIPEAIELLERIRQNKPAKFPSEQEEDAWFVAHRLLGDMYLEDRPADAVPCFLEFRKSSRAGADTMYKLGRAYEALGDNPKAARCYEEVTTFSEHPLYYEARDGLDRVRRGVARG